MHAALVAIWLLTQRRTRRSLCTGDLKTPASTPWLASARHGTVVAPPAGPLGPPVPGLASPQLGQPSWHWRWGIGLGRPWLHPPQLTQHHFSQYCLTLPMQFDLVAELGQSTARFLLTSAQANRAQYPQLAPRRRPRRSTQRGPRGTKVAPVMRPGLRARPGALQSREPKASWSSACSHSPSSPLSAT